MATLAQTALTKSAYNDLSELVAEVNHALTKTHLTTSHPTSTTTPTTTTRTINTMEKYAIPAITDIFYELHNEDPHQALPIRLAILELKLIKSTLIPLLTICKDPPQLKEGVDYIECNELKRWSKCIYQVVRLLAVVTTEIPEENVGFISGGSMERELLGVLEGISGSLGVLEVIVQLLQHYLACRSYKQGKLMPAASHRVEDARIENILRLIRNLLLFPGGRCKTPGNTEVARRGVGCRKRMLGGLKRGGLFDVLGIVADLEMEGLQGGGVDSKVGNEAMWLITDVYGLACEVRSMNSARMGLLGGNGVGKKVSQVGRRWGTRDTGAIVLKGRLAGSNRRVVMSGAALEQERREGKAGKVIRECSEMLNVMRGKRKDRRIQLVKRFEEKAVDDIVRSGGYNAVMRRMIELLTMNKGVDEDEQVDYFLRFTAGCLGSINTTTSRYRRHMAKGKKSASTLGDVKLAEVRDAVGEKSFKVVVRSVAEAIDSKLAQRTELGTAALKEMMTLLLHLSTVPERPRDETSTPGELPENNQHDEKTAQKEAEKDAMQMDLVVRGEQSNEADVPSAEDPAMNDKPSESEIEEKMDLEANFEREGGEDPERAKAPDTSGTSGGEEATSDVGVSEENTSNTTTGRISTEESEREFALNTLERLLENGSDFTGEERKGYSDILSMLLKDYDAKAHSWNHLVNVVELGHAFVEMMNDGELSDVVVRKKRKKRKKNRRAGKPEKSEDHQEDHEESERHAEELKLQDGEGDIGKDNEKKVEDGTDEPKEKENKKESLPSEENKELSEDTMEKDIPEAASDVSMLAEKASDKTKVSDDAQTERPSGDSLIEKPSSNGEKSQATRTAELEEELDVEEAEEEEYFASLSSELLLLKFAHARVVDTLMLVLRCMMCGTLKVGGELMPLPQGANVIATTEHGRKAVVVLRRIWNVCSRKERGTGRGCFYSLTTLHTLHGAMIAAENAEDSNTEVVQEISKFGDEVIASFLEWLKLSPSLALDSLSQLDKTACMGYERTACDIRARDLEEVVGLPDEEEGNVKEGKRRKERRKWAKATVESDSEYSELELDDDGDDIEALQKESKKFTKRQSEGKLAEERDKKRLKRIANDLDDSDDDLDFLLGGDKSQDNALSYSEGPSKPGSSSGTTGPSTAVLAIKNSSDAKGPTDSNGPSVPEYSLDSTDSHNAKSSSGIKDVADNDLSEKENSTPTPGTHENPSHTGSVKERKKIFGGGTGRKPVRVEENPFSFESEEETDD